MRNARTVLQEKFYINFFYLYESLIFLTWSLSLIHITLENIIQNAFIGAILAPSTLFINGFALFHLPNKMQQITPLIPALKSNWLIMHVTVMMLSYATLLSGSLLSISLLILNWIQIDPSNYSKAIWQNSIPQLQKSQKILSLLFEDSRNQKVISFPLLKKSEFQKNLDNLSYRLINIGFAFLTIGILSGAVWANEAWGSYWSWDPKETWALITWINFAIYLHTRLVKGWKGVKSAFVASFGFIILWICYLGVNLFGKGLHSYGWFI